MARYLQILSEYEYEIEYVRGQDLVSADALSRSICRIKGCPSCSNKQIAEINAIDIQFLSDITPEELIDKQILDDDISWIIEVLNKDIALSDKDIKTLTGNKRFYFSHLDSLHIKENMLVYEKETPSGEMIFVPVLPKSLVPQILDKYHKSLPQGGHYKVYKTLSKIQLKFFWPSMRKDVIEYCQNCLTCLKTNPTYTHQRAPLCNIISTEFNQRVNCDIIGPLPATHDGNKYILTIVDCFSKYIVCVPIKSMTAEEIANCLLIHWISKFSVFKIFQTDNASDYRSALIKQLCKLLGVTKTFSTPYMPSVNGQAENINKSIKQFLLKYVAENNPLTWDTALPLFNFVYNTTPHYSTKVMPFQVVFGRLPNFPDDVYISQSLCDIDIQDIHQYIRNLQDMLLKTQQFANENLNQAREKQRVTYNKKSKDNKLVRGQDVLLYQDVMPANTSSKFFVPYRGPYRISQVLSDLTYKIYDPNDPNSKPKIVHRNKLRPIPKMDMAIPMDPEERYAIEQFVDNTFS